MELTKIYGIEFDESVPQGGEKRLFAAENMKNDYVVGDRFQLNGGRNDFDNTYPFGAIRVCNVAFRDGVRCVTYEGEPGFSRTGENGNVMVQIPRFYSKREKIGSVERWMISGTKHPGFEIEPAFTRGGKELDCIYVGAYNYQDRGNGLFSSSGDLPDVSLAAHVYTDAMKKEGYDPYDLAVYLCLQKLIVIEFGTRYVKQHLGGIGFLRYFSGLTSRNCIQEMAPNRITICRANWGDHFAPGHEIGIGHVEDDPSIHATIERIEVHPSNPEWLDIYYAGEDLQGTVFPEQDAAYGIGQRNGLSDGISYHTGRADLRSLAPECDYLVNAFRYRGIENVWGNVWEHMEGLRIRNLQYSYTFDPELYDSDPSRWKQVSFTAPHQHYLAEKATDLWTDTMGYDPNKPLLLLPCHSVGNKSHFGKYYDSAVYSYTDKDYSDRPVDPQHAWRFVVGGGYDHSFFGSLFTYRGFISDTLAEWIYSHRVCLRR